MPVGFFLRLQVMLDAGNQTTRPQSAANVGIPAGWKIKGAQLSNCNGLLDG
jgi:hypothetical protein